MLDYCSLPPAFSKALKLLEAAVVKPFPQNKMLDLSKLEEIVEDKVNQSPTGKAEGDFRFVLCPSVSPSVRISFPNFFPKHLQIWT